MSNKAGLAAIRAVGLLHDEGYELLRVWVAAGVQSEKSNFVGCNIHLHCAGESPQQAVNFEVDHIALSFHYTMNANTIVGGKLYPDPDPKELNGDGWYDPRRMADYLKGEIEISQRWRGSDAAYAAWFKQLVRLAEAGKLPVMVLEKNFSGTSESGAVLVEPFNPSRVEPLFNEEPAL